MDRGEGNEERADGKQMNSMNCVEILVKTPTCAKPQTLQFRQNMSTVTFIPKNKTVLSKNAKPDLQGKKEASDSNVFVIFKLSIAAKQDPTAHIHSWKSSIYKHRTPLECQNLEQSSIFFAPLKSCLF